MLFAMEFLEPSTYKLWKTELLEGRVDPICAGWMGSTLGKIHAKAANDPSVKDLFPPNEIFHAIRLEPYLEATALKHPDLKDTLFSLSKRTRETSLTLIHGDVSPKNILLGPKGVVILDAECACLGDPRLISLSASIIFSSSAFGTQLIVAHCYRASRQWW